jgi:hypothetical protein
MKKIVIVIGHFPDPKHLPWVEPVSLTPGKPLLDEIAPSQSGPATLHMPNPNMVAGPATLK